MLLIWLIRVHNLTCVLISRKLIWVKRCGCRELVLLHTIHVVIKLKLLRIL